MNEQCRCLRCGQPTYHGPGSPCPADNVFKLVDDNAALREELKTEREFSTRLRKLSDVVEDALMKLGSRLAESQADNVALRGELAKVKAGALAQTTSLYADVAVLEQELRDSAFCDNCVYYNHHECGVSGGYTLGQYPCGQGQKNFKGGYKSRVVAELSESSKRFIARVVALEALRAVPLYVAAEGGIKSRCIGCGKTMYTSLECAEGAFKNNHNPDCPVAKVEATQVKS